MGRMLHIFRRTFAGCLFLLLLLYVGGAISEIYGFAPSIISRMQFVPALLAGSFGTVLSIILFTLFFGRWYCSFLCPLGILQDILGRLQKKKAETIGWQAGVIRCCVLIFCFASLFFGFSLVLLLVDPWSVFGRLTTTFALPVITFVNNLLAALFNDFGLYAVTAKKYRFTGGSVFLTALFSLSLLTYFLYRYGGRSWCNTLCPVGTVLSVFAGKSILRVQIDRNKCISCGRCERHCKAGVITLQTKRVDAADCVACFSCLPVCKDDAISYSFSRKGNRYE